MHFFPFDPDKLPFVIIVIVIAFTVHEFAHAYTAYKFGDKTAYNEGRVTLNPIVHLDFFGTLLILIAGFGWAKPVPVNPSRFKYRRLMGIIVSLAGPVSNLLLGILGLFIVQLLNSTHVLSGTSVGVISAIGIFLNYFVYYNILLFLFNLIPLPPLDGYRIVADLLPLRIRYQLDQYAQWGVYIFLLLVFIPPLRAATIGPYLSNIGRIEDFFFTLFAKLL